jgi:hypothetical protein
LIGILLVRLHGHLEILHHRLQIHHDLHRLLVSLRGTTLCTG